MLQSPPVLPLLLATCFLAILGVHSWVLPPSPRRVSVSSSSSSSSSLPMGFLDNVLSTFLDDREGDFVELDKMDSEFGPGPALILYKVPDGILLEEVRDMLEDGAPRASAKGVALQRIVGSVCPEGDAVGEGNDLLDLSLQQALERVVESSSSPSAAEDNELALLSSPNQQQNQPSTSSSYTPVLLFSGFSNPEMLAAYNIIGGEIYQETSEQVSAACAKAVPNAMGKPLRQVLEEIAGDHQEAQEGGGGNSSGGENVT